MKTTTRQGYEDAKAKKGRGLVNRKSHPSWQRWTASFEFENRKRQIKGIHRCRLTSHILELFRELQESSFHILFSSNEMNQE
jgi:hypothetical protein